MAVASKVTLLQLFEGTSIITSGLFHGRSSVADDEQLFHQKP